MSIFADKTDHHEEHLLTGQNRQFKRHVHSPRCLGLLKKCHGNARGIGSCGDSVEINLELDGMTIVAIGQLPHGCAFTIACASAVCQLAKGKTLDEALLITPETVESELGGLPEDHRHCARLAVNTLGEAISSAYRSAIHNPSLEGGEDAHI